MPRNPFKKVDPMSLAAEAIVKTSEVQKTDFSKLDKQLEDMILQLQQQRALLGDTFIKINRFSLTCTYASLTFETLLLIDLNGDKFFFNHFK